jgi:hypothetical protein
VGTLTLRGGVRENGVNKERDMRTPQKCISIEFRAKGTVAVLTDIIGGFASKSGLSIGFRPGGRPDWSAHVADMRMDGPVKKIDTLTPHNFLMTFA